MLYGWLMMPQLLIWRVPPRGRREELAGAASILKLNCLVVPYLTIIFPDLIHHDSLRCAVLLLLPPFFLGEATRVTQHTFSAEFGRERITSLRTTRVGHGIISQTSTSSWICSYFSSHITPLSRLTGFLIPDPHWTALPPSPSRSPPLHTMCMTMCEDPRKSF